MRTDYFNPKPTDNDPFVTYSCGRYFVIKNTDRDGGLSSTVLCEPAGYPNEQRAVTALRELIGE